MPVMYISTIGFYHFYTSFSDLDLGQGLQGQHKAKPVGFIFSRYFRMNDMKLSMAMKQFKLNILRLALTETSDQETV